MSNLHLCADCLTGSWRGTVVERVWGETAGDGCPKSSCLCINITRRSVRRYKRKYSIRACCDVFCQKLYLMLYVTKPIVRLRTQHSQNVKLRHPNMPNVKFHVIYGLQKHTDPTFIPSTGLQTVIAVPGALLIDVQKHLLRILKSYV